MVRIIAVGERAGFRAGSDYLGSVLRSALIALSLVAALAGGCSNGEDGGQDGTAGSTCQNDGGAGPYFLFEHEDWEFKGATDLPEDLGPMEAIEPSLDWYAEHERLTPSTDGAMVEGVSLRLSGHDADLDEHQDELSGFDAEEQLINGVRALAGIGPDLAPTVVTVTVTNDYTLMLLSYGLELEELIDLAARRVHQVCQPEWIEAGGEILDCLPADPGCTENPPPTPTSSSSEPVLSTTEGP